MVPLPNDSILPSLDEQQRIVNKLHDKVTSINQLLPMLGGKAKETMINYKQALIADALGFANKQ